MSRAERANRRGFPRIATLVLSLSASVVGFSCTPAAGGKPAGTAEVARGAAPDFELESLRGGSVRLSDHLGRDVVLIDFWATYCEPCLASLPHVDALYEKYKGRGLVVLGVSIDGPDSVGQVRGFVDRLHLSFPILLDQETRVVGLYNPKTSAPYSVLIGRDGRVAARREGYGPGGFEALEADVAAAVNAK